VKSITGLPPFEDPSLHIIFITVSVVIVASLVKLIGASGTV